MSHLLVVQEGVHVNVRMTMHSERQLRGICLSFMHSQQWEFCSAQAVHCHCLHKVQILIVGKICLACRHKNCPSVGVSMCMYIQGMIGQASQYALWNYLHAGFVVCKHFTDSDWAAIVYNASLVASQISSRAQRVCTLSQTANLPN